MKETPPTMLIEDVTLLLHRWAERLTTTYDIYEAACDECCKVDFEAKLVGRMDALGECFGELNKALPIRYRLTAKKELDENPKEE